VIWLAVIGARGRVVGSNPKYTGPELAHLLQLTKPKFIFAQPDCMKPIVDASAKVELDLRNSTRIFSLDSQASAVDGVYDDWRTLLGIGKNPKMEKIFENSDSEQSRIVMYGLTSGTTGMPKAAMVSCRSVVAQASLIEDQFNARTYQVPSPAPRRKLKETILTLRSRSSSYACQSSMRSLHRWPLYYHSDLACRHISFPDGRHRNTFRPLRSTPSLTLQPARQSSEL
jgi:acyl-CoA synthetase (AMP-forming)/AMP-acid ligase II